MKIEIGEALQQGDVFICKVEKLPEGLKKSDYIGGRIVLAEGESHGHAHAIADIDSATMFIDGAGNKFLEISAPVTIRHEEHSAFTIDTGVYAINIIQEFDHFAQEARNVRD